MDRRHALKLLAAAPWALTAGTVARARAQGAAPRLTILVFLYGGNDGFNTWVPYTDALYYKLRPTIAVPRDRVLRITDRHGFHPALAPLMPAWEARELALLQGVGYAEATQQHYRDGEIAFTGEDRDYREQGWVTRALGGAPRRVLAVGQLDVRALDPMGPFRGERLPVIQLHHARELLVKRKLADCVAETNPPGAQWQRGAGDALPAPALGTRFPDDPFGEAARMAVEVAAARPDIPVLHLTLNGLDGDKHHSVDTHWKQLEYHGDALRRLAEGLAALRAGLTEIGRWNDTLVVTYDEFGRAPVENADHGTHHGLGTTHLALGGRVKGGLHGEAPPVERVFQVGGPAPAVDTRRVWTTVIDRWWGADAANVFERRYAALDFLEA